MPIYTCTARHWCSSCMTTGKMCTATWDCLFKKEAGYTTTMMPKLYDDIIDHPNEAKILSGKPIAESILANIARKVQSLSVVPKLLVITIGDNDASTLYLKNKHKDCEKCGIEFTHKHFTSTASLAEIKEYLATGITCPTILQLPIKHKSPAVVEYLRRFFSYELPVRWDVDGFGFQATTALCKNEVISEPMPCTPNGICTLLESIPGFSYSGKHAVIIGRSNIVGRPLALILLNKDCTVSICHSKTIGLDEITRTADILVSAVGQKNLITSEMVKPNAIVIDVGINRDNEGKLCGDVDFENVKKIASYITPVPGGVGLMTRAMLIQNVYRSYECNEI